MIVSVVLVVSTLVALALSRLLQRGISHPLLSLAETAKTISTRRDYSVRAIKFSNDEVGALTDAFNHMLTQLQERNTALRQNEERFRQLAGRISVLLAAEALRDVPTVQETVSTPLGPAHGTRVRTDVVLVPVLRAGLGMLPGMLELVPGARVGHIGLQRDERTAVASQYYAKLPPGLADSYVLMIDPMLATGGSAVAALDMLSRAGARHIRLVCIVAAPEGVAAVEKAYLGE